MPRHSIPLVINLSDFAACGCAYCGHTDGYPPAQQVRDDAFLWRCAQSRCQGTTVVVADELEESPYGFEGTRPKVQEHPLKQPPQTKDVPTPATAT